MSTVTRLLAGNWGFGASFLAVAQTFLMMWHNQTFKCLYTLQQHSMFYNTVSCNICIYFIFIATVGLQPTAGVLCLFLQW